MVPTPRFQCSSPISAWERRDNVVVGYFSLTPLPTVGFRRNRTRKFSFLGGLHEKKKKNFITKCWYFKIRKEPGQGPKGKELEVDKAKSKICWCLCYYQVYIYVTFGKQGRFLNTHVKYLGIGYPENG